MSRLLLGETEAQSCGGRPRDNTGHAEELSSQRTKAGVCIVQIRSVAALHSGATAGGSLSPGLLVYPGSCGQGPLPGGLANTGTRNSSQRTGRMRAESIWVDSPRCLLHP